jgi:hypothetical protein
MLLIAFLPLGLGTALAALDISHQGQLHPVTSADLAARAAASPAADTARPARGRGR